MHGQIGEFEHRANIRSPQDFYDANRAAMREDARRLGNGTIDYDYYRARARRLQSAALRRSVRRLARYVRPLIAIAAVIAAIWVMPTRGEDCAVCGANPASALMTATR